MTDTSNTIKHIASPLARQTLQDGALTRPVASVRCCPGCKWSRLAAA